MNNKMASRMLVTFKSFLMLFLDTCIKLWEHKWMIELHFVIFISNGYISKESCQLRYYYICMNKKEHKTNIEENGSKL